VRASLACLPISPDLFANSRMYLTFMPFLKAFLPYIRITARLRAPGLFMALCIQYFVRRARLFFLPPANSTTVRLT